jgi:hypothetical protein
MRKIVFQIFILTCLYSGLKAQNLIHAEMVGRPTNNSATIQLIFSDSS